MAENIIVKAHEDHVLQHTALLKLFRAKRGTFKTEKGYSTPLASNGDARQLLEWWDAEFKRSRANRDWYKDGDKEQWKRDRERIAEELRDADPAALYRDNDWLWNRAFLKLAILLQVAKSRPSPTQLFVESVKETIRERVDDADNAASTAGKVIDAAAHAGERAWNGLKIAGLVAAGLIGAAVVLPPIIRAFRD